MMPTGKQQQLISDLNDVLSNGMLTPWEAAKLRGRLGYGTAMAKV